jgi:hypothetical protein
MSGLVRSLDGSPAAYAACLRTMVGLFGVRGWLMAAGGGLATLLVIGLPTALVENPVFGRQLAARPEDYVFWVLTAVLAGLIAGSFVIRTDVAGKGTAATGGFLSFIAVGCPICNKVAVAALGTSGALSVFGPAQLYIGIGAIVLLSWAVLVRARAVAASCPRPVTRA